MEIFGDFLRKLIAFWKGQIDQSSLGLGLATGGFSFMYRLTICIFGTLIAVLVVLPYMFFKKGESK